MAKKKILLICIGGMTTSLIATKLQREAKSQGYDFEISADTYTNGKDHAEKYDMILVGPHVSFAMKPIVDLNPDKPVALVPALMFGRMEVKQMLKLVLDSFAEKGIKITK